VIALALNAIGRARQAHDELIDALEDAQDVFHPRPLPDRCEWGAAVVGRYVNADDRWIADIICGSEGPRGIVWPALPSLPEGATLLELVTAGGERVLLTPGVCRALAAGRARLLGITPIIWSEELGELGDDEPLPNVGITIVPQSAWGDWTLPLPQIYASLSAASVSAPYVLLAAGRPPGLPW
jgi:hypothetical protein